MKLTPSTLRTCVFLSLGLVGWSGCQTDGSSYKDFFPPHDHNRRVIQFIDVQSDLGAQDDATLQSYHFDGKKLNSLGLEKLDRMIPEDPDADITVYVNLKDDAMASDRKADVLAYLDEVGVASSHVKLEAGENPDNATPSAEQIKNLPKADSGEAAGGAAGASSAEGSGSASVMK